MFMPRAAARIFLRVERVGVERLQDISAADAKAEGVSIANAVMRGGYGGDDSPHWREAYAELWDSINDKKDGGAYLWVNNCWVFVYEFEVLEKP